LRLVPALAAAAEGAPNHPARLRFGRFELQVQEGQLLADGQAVPLRAKALDVLLALVEQAGQLVTRQALMDRVWANLVVEENNLSVQINALRKVLGGEIIATVPGRGYRFTLPVEHAAADTAAPQLVSQAPLPSLRTNLSERPAPLVGREAELAALDALLDRQRLVTVLGSAGMGKTRLALAALHARRSRYAHEVCFVDLAKLQPGDETVALVGLVAASLGLAQPGGADPVAGLVKALARLEVLIALDNAEHVVDTVAALAAALLAGAPGVQLLVTSQAPLRVADEWIYRLGALALPAGGADADTALQYGAVALFALRAQAQDTRFAVTDDNVARVVELCTRLDGAPLAIELAAARAPHLGLQALVAGLDQRLSLLTGGRRDAPARQQTLRAALQWSHELLSANEQAVFRRLSVCVGGASLAVALQVVADDAPGGLDEWATLDALGALVDRGLVVVEDSPQGSDTLPRYRHLDTPLALAREQLRACGEEAETRRRHAAAMRAHHARVYAALMNGLMGFEAARAEIDLELDGGLAACTWAAAHDAETAWVLAAPLSRRLFGIRHTDAKALWQAVEPLLDAAIASPSAVPSPSLARALYECSCFWGAFRQSHSRARAGQAVAVAVQAGDELTRYLALENIALLSCDLGHWAEYEAVTAEMRTLANPDWSPYVKMLSSQHEYRQAWRVGDWEAALQALRMWLVRVDECGHQDPLPYVLMVMVLVEAQRPAEALDMARTQLARFARRPGGPSIDLLSSLAWACLANGDTVQARDALQQVWPLSPGADIMGAWAGWAALLAALEHRPRAALMLLGFSDAAFEREELDNSREPFEERMAERAEALACDALNGEREGGGSPEVLAALKARGAGLTEGAMVALALDRLDA
jgi:predicted ATPase/DNA-binding winged helix-turn-helix (wHTH) protein